MLVLLAGCRSSKQASRDKLSGKPGQELVESSKPGKARKAELAVIRHLAENKLNYAGLTANAHVKLTGLGKDFGANAKVLMKRDEVIRLSLRFIGMELGIIEFSPEGVLVVDRVQKQYVRVRYNEAKFLSQAKLDFNAVQALFWNELFVPGESDPAKHLDRFTFEKVEGSSGVVKVLDTEKLSYAFYTPVNGERIERLRVKKADESSQSNLVWKYDQFEKVGNRIFPLYMTMQTQHKEQRQVGLHLELSGLRETSEKVVLTQPSSRYTRRTLDEVIKRLK